MPEINAGDVVAHKIDRTQMTVRAVEIQGSEKFAICQWFAKNSPRERSKQKGVFPAHSITKIGGGTPINRGDEVEFKSSPIAMIVDSVDTENRLLTCQWNSKSVLGEGAFLPHSLNKLGDARTIVPGDVVELKSFGLALTVRAVDTSTQETTVICQWLSEMDLREEVFPFHELERIG